MHFACFGPLSPQCLRSYGKKFPTCLAVWSLGVNFEQNAFLREIRTLHALDLSALTAFEVTGQKFPTCLGAWSLGVYFEQNGFLPEIRTLHALDLSALNAFEVTGQKFPTCLGAWS